MQVSAVLLKAAEPVSVTVVGAVATPPVLVRVKVWDVLRPGAVFSKSWEPVLVAGDQRSDGRGCAETLCPVAVNSIVTDAAADETSTGIDRCIALFSSRGGSRITELIPSSSVPQLRPPPQ
ncbi:hypothetical protein RIU97_36475 [Streptomyces sp. 147326]